MIEVITFVIAIFTPAVIFWSLALPLWVANQRSETVTWRGRAFQCGLFSLPATIVLMGFSSAHIFQHQSRTGPTPTWLTVNLLGFFLWLVSFTAALLGRGGYRIVLLAAAILTLFADYVVSTFIH
jgi:hypothetical protein